MSGASNLEGILRRPPPSGRPAFLLPLPALYLAQDPSHYLIIDGYKTQREDPFSLSVMSSQVFCPESVINCRPVFYTAVTQPAHVLFLSPGLNRLPGTCFRPFIRLCPILSPPRKTHQ